MRSKIEFQTNIWQEVALRDPAGTDGSNDYGTFARFTTIADETLFLPMPAAQQLRSLKLQPGECFRIRKAELRNEKGKYSVFQFARPDQALEQNGTLSIPKETAAVSPAAAPAPTSGVTTTSSQHNNGNGNAGNGSNGVNGVNGSNGHQRPDSPFEHSGQAALLRDTTNMLVDVLASCKAYSAKFNGLIAVDDVKNLLITAYINNKGGKL